MYDYILAFDPSGSFEEGKGTTGWVLMDKHERLLDSGEIKAVDYKCKEDYWDAVVTILRAAHKNYQNLIVVIEEYILYRDKSKAQTNSKMETSKLIGVLQWACFRLKQKYTMQLAHTVKTRWADGVMLREGIIRVGKYGLEHTQSGRSLQVIHIRDAFRHAIHYVVCRNEDKPKTKRYTRITVHEQSNYRRF